MSLMDTPMALIDRILGRPPLVPPDEPMARMLERLAHELEPDPLYRRRLRGKALNRFVAAREGISVERPRSRAGRTTPIGRAVLVASFVLATGAASVTAASQVAMPGDALYGIKLRIEQLRIDVAPDDLKDELIVASLDARLAEIQVLGERGDWSAAGAVADQAVEIAVALEAMSPQTSPATAMALDHHVAVLEAVLADAPAAAVEALQGALDASSSAASVVKQNGWRAPAGPNPPGHAAPPPNDASSPEPTARPRPSNGNAPATNNGNGGAPSGGNGPAAGGAIDPADAATESPSAAPSATEAAEAPEATTTPRPGASPRGAPETPRGHGS
jgi:hypothetical protein